MQPTGERWRLGHRPALDGLRGIAVLLVVATHAAAFLLPASSPAWTRLPGAGLGVDVFFTLSGFLITSLLLQELDRSGRIRLTGFYGRRGRRLLPAAVTVVAIWCAYLAAAGVGIREIGRTLALIATYTTNYAKSADSDVVLGLGHFWSLAVEEQFYFLWPILLLLAARVRLHERWVAVAALGAAAVVALHRTADLMSHPAADVMFRTENHCDGLLIGAALSIAIRQGWLKPRTWLAVPSLASLLVLAIAAPEAAFQGGAGALTYTITPLLSGLAILGSLDAKRGVLRSSWLRYVGRISYGLYLWHVPAIVLVADRAPWNPAIRTPLAIAVSFGLAALSWVVIERRWLKAPASRGLISAGDHHLVAGRPDERGIVAHIP